MQSSPSGLFNPLAPYLSDLLLLALASVARIPQCPLFAIRELSHEERLKNAVTFVL